MRAPHSARSLLALVVAAGAAATFSQPAGEGLLTVDRLLDIAHPSQPAWAPDAARVAFVEDKAGIQNVRIIDTREKKPTARAVTNFESGAVENLWWAKNGASLFFVHDGDLWQAAIDARGGGTARAVWTTAELEDQVAPSPDGARVAFVRGGAPGIETWQRTQGDLWIRSLADGREVRLTQNLGVVSGPAWSPDGTRLAFAVSRVELKSEAPAYSGAKILYTRLDRQPSTPAIVSAEGGKPMLLSASPGWDVAPVWLDNARVLLQTVSADNRTREILVAEAATGRTQLVYRETDAKFWSLPFVAPDPAPSPDGRLVAFVSDRDGWDHLYMVPTAGGQVTQLTKGRFEVRDPAWSPDSTRVAFDRSEETRPGVRHLEVATTGADPARAKITRLTTGRGTNIGAVWAPDGKRVVYQHTDASNPADLFVVAADGGEQAARLTDSLPSGVGRSALVEPRMVKYRASDGLEVPAYLFVRKGLDTGKHPAIVWVHGDGINQNYDGWHVERNYAVYYSFHQYLAQRGYVVLAPDYRGSIGYGRDWRQAVYMDVGGKDAEDAAASADYLKTLPYVDAQRIGIWGLSYGGYFTLVAMADHSKTFRCGVDVAGVVDYRMWYDDPGGAWVTARMGTPQEQPAVYDKAAVIDRVTRIERPLLVLHGTADGNVPYVETVRLLDVLLKAGKDVEFMSYPGEFHYFHRRHVLKDAWQRVDAFFGKHLQPGT